MPSVSRPAQLQPPPAAARGQDLGRPLVRDVAFAGFAAAVLLVGLWFAATPGLNFWSDTTKFQEDVAGGSLLRKLQWFPLLLASLFLLYVRLPLALLMLRRMNPFIPALGVLAVASAAWSLYPDLTIKRVILLWSTILIPLAFTITAWTPRRMDDHLRWILLVMMIVSTGFELIRIVFHVNLEIAYAPYWRGITFHKNTLGPIAVVSSLFWIHGWLERRTSLAVTMFALAFSLACLVGAGSGTADLLFVLTVPLVVFFSRPAFELRGVLLPLVLGTVVLAGSLVGLFMVFKGIPTLQEVLTPATAMVGKNATFTDRDIVWSFAWDHILQRPLLGYGFSAFWELTNPDVYDLSHNKMFIYVNEAHNGYLNVWLELGGVGVALLVGFIAWEIGQVARVARVDRSMAALQAGFLALFVLNNVSEALVMQGICFQFMFWLLCSYSMTRCLVQEQLRAAGGVRPPAAAQATPVGTG